MAVNLSIDPASAKLPPPEDKTVQYMTGTIIIIFLLSTSLLLSSLMFLIYFTKSK